MGVRLLKKNWQLLIKFINACLSDLLTWIGSQNKYVSEWIIFGQYAEVLRDRIRGKIDKAFVVPYIYKRDFLIQFGAINKILLTVDLFALFHTFAFFEHLYCTVVSLSTAIILFCEWKVKWKFNYETESVQIIIASKQFTVDSDNTHELEFFHSHTLVAW